MMDHQWRLSKIISYKNYKELGLSCEQIRQERDLKVIKNSGWHLSYFGDEKFIKNKLENFGHQEYKLAEHCHSLLRQLKLGCRPGEDPV